MVKKLIFERNTEYFIRFLLKKFNQDEVDCTVLHDDKSIPLYNSPMAEPFNAYIHRRKPHPTHLTKIERKAS